MLRSPVPRLPNTCATPCAKAARRAILFRDNLAGPAQAKAVVTQLRRAQPRPLICVDQEAAPRRIVSWVRTGESAREQRAAGAEGKRRRRGRCEQSRISVVLAPVATCSASCTRAARLLVRLRRCRRVGERIRSRLAPGRCSTNRQAFPASAAQPQHRRRIGDDRSERCSAAPAGSRPVPFGDCSRRAARHGGPRHLSRDRSASHRIAVEGGGRRAAARRTRLPRRSSRTPRRPLQSLRWRVRRRPQCATCVRASTSS